MSLVLVEHEHTRQASRSLFCSEHYRTVTQFVRLYENEIDSSYCYNVIA